MNNIRTITSLVLVALLVTGCATNEEKPKLDIKIPSGDLDYKPAPPRPAKLGVTSRMPRFSLPATVADVKLYSFRATGQPVRLALSQLATAYKLNIVVDQDVDGLVTVDLKDLPLEKVLEATLEPLGLAWTWQDGLLRVSRLETRIFQIDYLRLVRTGSGNSSSSTTLSGGGGGSSGSATSSIAQDDTIDFWSELEDQLDAILERSTDDYGAGDRPMETTVQTDRETNITTTLTQPVLESEGRLVIDRLSGTIQVTTSRARMKNVVEFIKRVTEGIKRQVYIEARVVEVSLSDDQAFGVDWNKLNLGDSLQLSSDVAISSPADGANVKSSTGSGSYIRKFSLFGTFLDIDVAVNALKEQGQVKVVSQPRIRTLNNQPAIVRVGTERTFFVTETDIDSDTNVQTTSHTATTITEGLVLTVTPQISGTGEITMDVTPVLTRITGTDTSPDGLSNAPRLDVKQSSTLVRMLDGETIVVGGLIKETVSNTERSVPVLGALPVVGMLFKANYDRDDRTELIIFITPHIIE
ncbi:MAG: secretin N-terminal domain-containing protein [Candidatus Sedimenticola sp. (ex Thyasira tokunagai)]